jgi:hypothetical protein
MIRHCEHVKTNGHFCGSPAMRGRNYCYFHLNVAGHRLRAEKFAAGGESYFPELPLLEDAASIQIALMQVNEWLLRGMIDYRRAGLLLYSLQTASCNLRNMKKEAETDAITAICNRYDSFEQDYELENCEQMLFEDPADKAEAEAAEKARAALQNGEMNGKAAGSKYDSVMALIAEGKAKGYLHTKGVCMLRDDEDESGPRHLTDREVEDKGVRIPLNLTETQYLQAKQSIEGYEQQHNIDAEHPRGRKPVPQRAAMSQKISWAPANQRRA